MHVNPTLAVSTTSTTTAHVAWEAETVSPPGPVLVYRKGTSGNFGSQYTVFVRFAYKPSLTGLSDDNAYMLYQNSYSGGGISKAAILLHGRLVAVGKSDCRVRHRLLPAALGGLQQREVSLDRRREQPLYGDPGDRAPLSKTDLLALGYSRELNLIDTTTGSSVTLEIGQPQLVHKDGTTTQLAFVDAPADSVLIGAGEIFAFGKTKPFVPTAASDTIRFQYTLRTINSAAALGDAGGVLSFSLTDPKAGTVLSTIGTHVMAKSTDTTSAVYEVGMPAASIMNRMSTGGFAIEPLLIGVKKDASDLTAGLGHIYRLEGEDAVELAKSAVAENQMPQSNLLEQNYPNPFNPSTTLRFGLPEASHVTLVVYNTLGQKVAELASGEMAPGFHEVRWDASGVASGVYVARLAVTDGSGQMLASQATKLVLMK